MKLKNLFAMALSSILILSSATTVLAAQPKHFDAKVLDSFKQDNKKYLQAIKDDDLKMQKAIRADDKRLELSIQEKGEAKTLKKKLEEKYSSLIKSHPDEFKSYLKNLDMFNSKKVNKKISELVSTQLSPNFTKTSKIIEMDDGSAIKVTQELVKNEIKGSKNNVSILNQEPYGPYTYTFSVSYYHFGWPDSVETLASFLYINSGEIQVTGAGNGGSNAVFPLVLNSSASVTDSLTKAPNDPAVTVGNFTLNLLGTNGIAIASVSTTLVSTFTFTDSTMYGDDFSVVNSQQ